MWHSQRDYGRVSSLQRNVEATKTEGGGMSDPVLPLTDLAQQINTRHAQVRGAFLEGVEYALACGLLLLQVKDRLPRGQWLAWLAERCPDMSERRAQRYMRVARDVF
jgi:hypothetical protein